MKTLLARGEPNPLETDARMVLVGFDAEGRINCEVSKNRISLDISDPWDLDEELRNLAKEESRDALAKEHAAAMTEHPLKETILPNSTPVIDTSNMTRAQAQMTGAAVLAFKPDLDPAHLVSEIHSMRGTDTINKLVGALANVLEDLKAEMDASEPEPEPHPTNACTTHRMSFEPIPGEATSRMNASLPANSAVKAHRNPDGTLDLYAWIDCTGDRRPDYVRRNVSRREFTWED
ncbi:hypothetical protein GCM10027417_30520 [Glutamicibacter endophyticus]